jgi:hypothetical protein
MKTYTLNDIRALRPCYDPGRYAPEDWYGTLLDILDANQVPKEDRLWVVLGLLDDRTRRLFAVWCARDALSRVDNPDQCSVAVCDVAERYADGLATYDELAAARAAAMDAARAAAWDAAWSAAMDAAWSAARDAQIAHLREMIIEADHV